VWNPWQVCWCAYRHIPAALMLYFSPFVCYMRRKLCHNAQVSNSTTTVKLMNIKTTLFVFNIHGSVHRNNILIYISNKMQCYTVYFIGKLLYKFWVVPSPIFRSVNNCIYSVCHPQHNQTSSNSSTIAADNNNSVTNTRCGRHSCLRSWRWVMVPPKTCRTVYKLCNIASCWIYITILE
jgi:hypothetical protein